MSQPISEAELIEIERDLDKLDRFATIAQELARIEDDADDLRDKAQRLRVKLNHLEDTRFLPNVRRLIDQARATNAKGIAESVNPQRQGIANP